MFARIAVAVAALVTLVGCASSSTAPSAGTTATTTATTPARWSPDESRLLAALAADSTVAPGVTDQTRVELGHLVCRYLDQGMGLPRAREGLADTWGDAVNADRFATIAATSMCPQHMITS